MAEVESASTPELAPADDKSRSQETGSDRAVGVTSQLTRRATLNMLATILDYGARMGVSFFVNPLLLNQVGSSLYGTWQVVTRSVGYIGTVDGRPTQALRWVISNKQRVDELDSKRRDIGSALLVWLLFSPLLVVLGGLLVWYLPLVIDVMPSHLTLVRLATAVLVLDILLTGFVGLPEAVLGGMNLGYKRIGWFLVVILGGGILTVFVLYMGWSLVGVAVAQIVTTLGGGLTYLLVVKRYLPWYGIGRPRLSDVKAFLSYSGWLFAATLLNRFIKVGDVIILGVVASSESVTRYVITNYVPQLVLTLLTMIITATLPGLGGIIGNNNLGRAAAVRRQMISLTWWLTTSLGTTIILWNYTFVGLWVGAENYAGNLPTMLIVLLMTQLVLIRNDDNIIDVSLDVRTKVLLGSVSTIVATVLAVLFARSYGIIGLCAGLLIGRSLISFGYPLLVSRMLKMTRDVSWRRLGWQAVLTGVGFSVALYLSSFIPALGWPGFFIGAGSSALVLLLFNFYIGLDKQARVEFSARLRTLLQPLWFRLTEHR